MIFFFNFHYQRKIVTEETMHSEEEPVKLPPIESDDTKGASGFSVAEADESDVTDKLQRLNLYFEKENVSVNAFSFSSHCFFNHLSSINSQLMRPTFSLVRSIYVLSVTKSWQ